MLGRMLWRSFREGRRRKMLAVVTVALAATLVTTLFALSVDVGDKMAREMTSYGSNIRVTPKADAVPLIIGGVDYNPLKGQDSIAETQVAKIKDIFWRNNIVGMAPRLSVGAMVATGSATMTAPLVGTYIDHPLPLPDDPGFRTGARSLYGFWHVTGDWPAEDKAEVLVGQRLQSQLGVAPGDSMDLTWADKPGQAPRAVKIAGILVTGGEEDGQVVAPLGLVQALSGQEGKVQAIDVSALTVPENDLSRKAHRSLSALSSEEYDKWYCTAYVSAIAHQIEEAVPASSARPLWQVAAGEGAVITRIQLLLLVVSAAAIVAAAMCVSALMTTTVSERAAEIGLMKALGATPAEIHALFIGEAVLVGLLGGTLGLVAGYGMAQAIGWSVFQSGVEIRPITAPVVLVLSVVTGLVGSILPARTIAALLPVEVLHGRR